MTKAVHDGLRGRLRVTDGRHAEPTAGVIDAQSVTGADTVGKDSRGYDAGKKINGGKRFLVTDTLGLLLTVLVCAASVADRQGGRRSLLGLHLDRLGVARRTRAHLPWSPVCSSPSQGGPPSAWPTLRSPQAGLALGEPALERRPGHQQTGGLFLGRRKARVLQM